MAKSSDGGNARDAGSGKFVTKTFAKAHPKTTVVEKKASPPPKGK